MLSYFLNLQGFMFSDSDDEEEEEEEGKHQKQNIGNVKNRRL
jgi:hypothetical protein